MLFLLIFNVVCLRFVCAFGHGFGVCYELPATLLCWVLMWFAIDVGLRAVEFWIPV